MTKQTVMYVRMQRMRDSICIFALWAKIIVATSVCTGGSNISVCGARRMSSAINRLRPSPTAAPAYALLVLPVAAQGNATTGQLHLDRFESLTSAIKNHQPRMWLVIFWQRMRDSNPRKRSQSPVCYRYTNPLYARHGYYYTHRKQKVKKFFPDFADFFLFSPDIDCPLAGEIMHRNLFFPREGLAL